MAKDKKKRLHSEQRVLVDDASISNDLKFRIEEAYKSIRANIMFSVVKKGCKIIVVSSSLPNEGKTTTTVNLAASISQADQRVLLIDGDLRKPKVHQYFAIPSAPGLTDYLSDVASPRHKMDIFGIIHPTRYENLSVITSGTIPPNPAELLGSDFMRDFLNGISKDFDYIIIDTPPLNVVSDALPLIRESDGIVLVVRDNQTTHPELQKALSSLEFIDAKILGFVVNFVESKAGKSGGSSYDSYNYGGFGPRRGYNYYYGYGEYHGGGFEYGRYDPRY